MAMPSRLLNISSRLASLANRNLKPTASSISGNSPLYHKCKSTSTTTAFSRVTVAKKNVGNITIRQMLQSDLIGVNELIQTRKLTDFCESDIYSVLQSRDFLGIVAENEAKEIVGFAGFLQYGEDTVIAGHNVIAESLRRNALGSDIAQLGERTFRNEHVFGFGFDFLKQYYERIGVYFDWEYGEFYKLVGTFKEKYIREEIECGADIVKADGVDFNDLFLYDQSIHTKPRHSVLHATCFHPTSTAYVAVRGGKVVGYAVLRECYLASFKIAPLFADDPLIGHALYQKLATHIPEHSKVCMFVCSKNDYTANFMDNNEFKAVRTLWRGSVFKQRSVMLPVDFNKVFSLTDSNFAIC